jgi:YVTN family beta-propeller protein
MNLFSKTVRLSALMVFAAVLIFETGCGDTFRPIATPIVQPGGDPQSPDNITVINCNGTTSHTGPLTNCAGTGQSQSLQINVPGDSLTLAANIGAAPGYASFDVNRTFFYVPDSATDVITAIALGGTATTLTVPQGTNPIGAFIGTGAEYVLNAGSGAVCPGLGVVPLGTFSVTQTYCIGSAPSFAVQTGSNLFILDKTLNQVNVFSPQQQKFIASITVGTAPVFATSSFDRNFVYVINQGSNDISIVDANAFTVVGTVPTNGLGPMKAMLDGSLNRLYVVNQGDNTVTGFDATGNSTLTKLGTATVGPTPVNVTVLTGGNRAFTANSGNNTLTEINTGSFTTRAVTVGQDPSALVTDVASSSDGSKLYAATVTSGNLKNGVTVIRASDNAVVNNLPSPRQDPNCAPTAAAPCPLQQPQQFIGGR